MEDIKSTLTQPVSSARGSSATSEPLASTRALRKLVVTGMGLRERQKVQRRERILFAAAELFNELGYLEATIEEIGVRAEVSAATVRNYYPSKGQLLLAIVERGDEDIHHYALTAARQLPGDATATLNDVVEKTTRHSLAYLNHKVWRHAIAISITREEPEYGTGFSASHSKFIESYQGVIKFLQERGKLDRDMDSLTMASVIYKIQHTLFVEMIGEAEPNLDRYLAQQRQHIEFIVQGARGPD